MLMAVSYVERGAVWVMGQPVNVIGFYFLLYSKALRISFSPLVLCLDKSGFSS